MMGDIIVHGFIFCINFVTHVSRENMNSLSAHLSCSNKVFLSPLLGRKGNMEDCFSNLVRQALTQ